VLLAPSRCITACLAAHFRGIVGTTAFAGGENRMRTILIATLLLTLAATRGAAAADAELIRQILPLSIRGVNYYPRETPWGGMWTKTPADVWEKDMALAASLGCNTIRTFLPFGSHLEQDGLIKPDGSLTPAYHEKFEQLLAAAWRHGIRVIVCFEFDQKFLTADDAQQRWQRTRADVARRSVAASRAAGCDAVSRVCIETDVVPGGGQRSARHLWPPA